MVNWDSDFPNLSNENIQPLKRRFERARSKAQRNSVLKTAEQLDLTKSLRKMGANDEGVIRFNNNNTLPRVRAKAAAAASRKKAINVAKRTGASVVATALDVAKRTGRVVRATMPTREQMLDLGWRLGQDIYDNRRGVEMFAELMILFLTATGGTSKLVNTALGKKLSPLNVSKEGIASRFARVYLTNSKNLGEIVKANAWLNSSQGTSILAIEFSMLLTFGIVLRLLFIGNTRATRKIARILDVFVSTIKLPGFTGLVSAETMLLSISSLIITFHAQILAAKGIDMSVDKYVADWMKLPMKTVLRWTKNKFLKQELVQFVLSRPMQLLLAVIADMRYAPKSGVAKVTKQIKTYVTTHVAPTQSLPQFSGNRTPSASGNSSEEAQSPLRPIRNA
jgi:hypothetical protein